MPCYRPLKGYRARTVNPSTGRRSIVFSARDGLLDFPVDLPCGQCIGCRLERSRQWAMRCMHEANLYERNCFITLTFRDECLPVDGSLDVKLFQDFMKRLRFRCGPGIRFFHCGEYGEKFGRPHYHACLFNFDFDDKYVWRRSDAGFTVFRSALLEEVWPYGNAEIGDVTFESAAYVARYITKKVTGDAAEAHYGGRKPEYTTMSRRPGIGKGWFDRWKFDVYPRDLMVLRGRQVRPPKYYDRQFEIAYPSDWAIVRRKRKRSGIMFRALEPETRLSIREEIHTLRFNLLKRGYEHA